MSSMNPHAASPAFGSIGRVLTAVSGAFAAFLVVLEDAQRMRDEAQARYGFIDE